MKRILFVVLGSVLCLAVAYGSGAQEGAGEDVIDIEVVSMGVQHEYWQTVNLGVQQAAEDLGLVVPFYGPAAETEVGAQMSLVENSIAKEVDAILLAPTDSEALIPVARRATELGIAVATFDVDINNPEYRISFIATDNYAAGELAGERMGELLDGRGTVGIVGHIAATMDTRERIDGFVDAMTENYPNIELLEPVYGDGDHQKSMDKATDLITGHPDLSGLYATNEGGAIGVALAVESAGKVGELTVVGFDSSEQEIRYLRDGVINGFVVQNPFQMGYLGVKILYEHVMGIQTAPERVDTGVVWVDNDNIDDEDIQNVLYPLGN
ncbi:MAG: ABC transporter substrate-binding protein [Alkalispirochaeta sp.]